MYINNCGEKPAQQLKESDLCMYVLIVFGFLALVSEHSKKSTSIKEFILHNSDKFDIIASLTYAFILLQLITQPCM